MNLNANIWKMFAHILVTKLLLAFTKFNDSCGLVKLKILLLTFKCWFNWAFVFKRNWMSRELHCKMNGFLLKLAVPGNLYYYHYCIYFWGYWGCLLYCWQCFHCGNQTSSQDFMGTDFDVILDRNSYFGLLVNEHHVHVHI